MFDVFVSGQPIGQHQHRIVRAHVAIHGDAIETLRHGFPQGSLQNLGSMAASVVMKQSIVACSGNAAGLAPVADMPG